MPFYFPIYLKAPSFLLAENYILICKALRSKRTPIFTIGVDRNSKFNFRSLATGKKLPFFVVLFVTTPTIQRRNICSEFIYIYCVMNTYTHKRRIDCNVNLWNPVIRYISSIRFFKTCFFLPTAKSCNSFF